MSQKKCVFCMTTSLDKELGPFYKVGAHNFHSNCLIFAFDIRQNADRTKGRNGFEKKNIDFALNRGKRRICMFCSKERATVRCWSDGESTCDKSFHLPCALASKETSHEYYGQFKSYCKEHNKLRCLFDTDPIIGIVIKPDCCGNSAHIHDKCIETYVTETKAQSKCPLCTNRPKFCSFVEKYFDIEISDQKASWAKVARDEYAYDLKCGAKQCKCVEKGYGGGRFRHERDPNKSFFLIECTSCGSDAIHRICGNVGNEDTWVCYGCDVGSDVRPEDEKTKKITPSESSSARIKKTAGIKKAPSQKSTEHKYVLRKRNGSASITDHRITTEARMNCGRKR